MKERKKEKGKYENAGLVCLRWTFMYYEIDCHVVGIKKRDG